MQTLKNLSIDKELEEFGIVVIPEFVNHEQLAGMQRSFEVRLRNLRWNDCDGYEKTERFRHMVQDVLTLDQGFVDAALHPVVKETLHRYLGDRYELCEAKGWKSLPTRTDFHGWHGDAWYDQSKVSDLPREVKLGIYLTNVTTGGFQYILGSHRKQAPRMIKNHELVNVPASQIMDVVGSAGTAFLFDTSGIHRQSVPILQERWAVFYNYHDPYVQIQQEDLDYYRYHPLVLNAALLGDLSTEDHRILGFGNKINYISAFHRRPKHLLLQKSFQAIYDVDLRLYSLFVRVAGRVRRLTRKFRSR